MIKRKVDVKIPSVKVFDEIYCDKAQALKPLEEAAEIFGAWQLMISQSLENEREAMRQDMLSEIADCIQACANLAYTLGVVDMTRYMESCENRNRARGRL